MPVLVRASISNNDNTKNNGQVDGDGDYLLVLKMSEVYFNAPNMKVFDVVLNGDLTVSSDLDIFEKVRSGTVEKTHNFLPGWTRSCT